MKKLIFIMVMALCASHLLFAQNTRYVAVQTVDVKSSAGFFARNVGTLSLGDTVTAVREDGKWTEVRTGSITGWVASASLSSRRIIAGSTTSATASEVAMAGKGFSPETEIEYRKGGLDYSMVDLMERTVIPADDLLRFITDGRLARGE